MAFHTLIKVQPSKQVDVCSCCCYFSMWCFFFHKKFSTHTLNELYALLSWRFYTVDVLHSYILRRSDLSFGCTWCIEPNQMNEQHNLHIHSLQISRFRIVFFLYIKIYQFIFLFIGRWLELHQLISIEYMDYMYCVYLKGSAFRWAQLEARRQKHGQLLKSVNMSLL